MMKRTVALLLAIVMTFGISQISFAQTVNRISHNVVVNGDKVTYEQNEAIGVNGSTMFSVSFFVKAFGLSAESVEKSGNAFAYESQNYYTLRDVANNNGFLVYWDGATRTIIVVNKSDFDEMKALLENYNNQSLNATRFEMDFDGNVDVEMTAVGLDESMDLAMPMSGSVQIDMENPYLKMDLAMSVEGQEFNTTIYDDGAYMYTLDPVAGAWYKTESSMAQSAELIEQIQSMNNMVAYIDDELSYAGLKLTKAGEETVLEGNMYTAETFNALNLDSMVKEMLAQMGDTESSLNYNMPSTIYVKYVFDNAGNLKSMNMNMGFGMNMNTEGINIVVNAYVSINVPKFIINGEFETVVPEEIVNNAIDMLAQ